MANVIIVGKPQAGTMHSCIQKKEKMSSLFKDRMHWCHSRQPNQNGLKSAATQSDVDCSYSICTEHLTSTDTDSNQSGRKYH